jgi:hypothetical protein
VALGRISKNFGPAEFIPMNEITQALLDDISATQGSILYRSASGWVALPPGTAGHFLKTNGAAANPEWAAASGGGGGAFNPPLASDFPTIVDNAGSTGAAADDADRGLLLTLTSTSGTISYTQFLKSYSLPGSGTDTFIWAARYTPTTDTSTNVCAGMVLADAASTTSDRLFFGFNLGPASPIDVFVRQATGNTTVAGGATINFDLNDSKRWFKLEVDSTGDIRFYQSADGAIWDQFQSTTVATHLGSVSHIGFILGGITNVTGNMSVFYYEES